MEGRMDGWNGQMDEDKDGWIYGCMDEGMDGWIYGWVDGRTVEGKDGWIYGRMIIWATG